ncbi:acyl-CoA mutase large subunit family protein [Tepidiforma thermophila]|uniref:Methylmalonyl-CoA mutase N-terminal domain/subunit n=1 Tax=Tepidiforma thermophila (strain KCTC 52669 / CGMCC 1.13589 / G233) TaxID=2761530 RepID=A0A2A9HJ47_TEPT2|nr:methylmalonyl-CoA mutase family protein [Tepidiforma thermophila]PFG75433.1 methylmalonyl-CoA mutase N-terminal domain/subunit [Tepidiforma thermophila]
MHVDPDRARQLRAEYDEAVLREGKELAGPFMTVSGRPINRVYDPTDTADLDYERDINLPGNYPFTRGIHRTGYRGKPWTIRMFSGFGSVEETNQRYKDLLAAGNNGLSIAFDMPTLMGYDHDDPWAEGEFGACGVAVDHLGDMEILLEGIPLDKITTSMTINSPAPVVWALFIAAAEKRGIPRAKLAGTLQNDILKEYIAQNEFIYPPAESMRLVTDTIEFASKEMPLWNPISVSGYHIREAGATAAQELAFTLADGIEYVKWALARGLDIDSFAPRISFFFNAHNDFFEEIAKYRAARRIWARQMRERFGAKNPRSWVLRFHTQTAGVSLTEQQPEVNLIRVAIQALAAVLGGTQSLHTDAMDEAIALPSDKAARLAVRTQQVILHETGVINTVDPLGGSWFVERLTADIERDALDYIEKIEALGGVIPAIESGYLQKEIADASARFQREVDTRDRIIVGVNEYVLDEPKEIPILRMDPEGEKRHLARLKKHRAERDPDRWAAAMQALENASRDPRANTMPYILDAVNAGATVGEVCNMWRRVFGEYREHVVV